MKKRFLVSFVFMFLLVSVWGMAEKTANNPMTVSPGSETEVVTVWQSCPTFSWSAVDQAASYRVAVFESVDANLATYETMAAMASPVLSKDIPGPALSWTLSADEKLKTGSQYTWYVQALDVNGNSLGQWSGGRIFRVEQELRFAGISEKLGEVLKSYGVKNETITNVLADMKSEVQEVVVSNEGGKNTPGLSGVKGTEGATNTFYGLNAGASNSTGYANTFIGSNAGYSNTTGYCNSFLGFYAGNNNETGSFNTFLGHQTGYENYGNYNTFLGTQAGLYNDGGSHNDFLGYQAGYSNSGGSYNTFLGNYSGKSNDNGFYNSFIGYKAGYSNTHGDENTFLGYYSGYGNITGNENTFLGYYSGYANTTGTDNTLLGFKAGYTNTSSGNTFVGAYAGYYDNTGNTNAFLGYYAGYNNNSGNANLFLGALAGFTNTTGYHNSFLGCSAGYNNNSGFDNTFLGFDAGLANTNGSDNTFLGSNAGFTNVSGSNNVFLGFDAGFNETGSNRLYIANSSASFPLIYGEFENGLVAINGKLGVGRQAPSYPIHMASGAYCSVGGAWTNASSRALKENIENLSIDEAIDALSKLNPVKYNYKIDKADKHVGFIAEDVPDLVASADRKGLSPMDVTAVLTKVVQELKRENQAQQNLIQEQQKIISELQERMAKLEKK
jgi:hypothetical protein